MNVRLIKSIDNTIGKLLLNCFSACGPRLAMTPKSILVIRPGGIGDAVLLIPAIHLIIKSYPEVKINILAESRNCDVFSLSPNIERVFNYNRSLELISALLGKYDVIIDTEQLHCLSAVVARLANAPVSIGYATNERKKLFTHPIPYSHEDYEVDSFYNLLAPLGVIKANLDAAHFLTVPDSGRTKVNSLLNDLMKGPVVVIFPGASIRERRWGADKFREVARRLHRQRIPVVVVGGKEDVSAGERIIADDYGINLAGKTSLIETAAVIEKAVVLVSGDSGILHIGVGLGKATVSLFGPGIAKKWAPRGDKHIVINKNLPCSPCTKFGYTPKCPIKAKCMADISVDEVFESIDKLLREYQEWK